MKSSESIKELATALAKAQYLYEPVLRTEHVGYNTTAGAKNYNYAPLESIFDACRKALSENGLAIVQPITTLDDKLMVETILMHISGEWISGEYTVDRNTKSPQAEGSALTYARRYSLSALLGVASEEDDDAQAAEQSPVKTQAKPKPAAPAPGPKEHWCDEHKTAFFMKGNMRSFAHPVKDAAGKQAVDEKGKATWCYEHHDKPESKTDPIADNADLWPDGKDGERIDEAIKSFNQPEAWILSTDVGMSKLKAALNTLQWTDVVGWMNARYRKNEKRVTDIIALLTDEEKAEFCQEVQKRLDEHKQ